MDDAKRTRERLLPLDRALGLSTRGSSCLNAMRLRYQVLCWSFTHRHGKKYARARARAVCMTEELNTKWQCFRKLVTMLGLQEQETTFPQKSMGPYLGMIVSCWRSSGMRPT